MKKCIFCSIAEGNSDNKRVIAENDNFLAMLVSHPLTNGHFIVFPKRHYSELSEMLDIAGEMISTTISWAEMFMPLLAAKAYVMKTNNKVYLLEDKPLHVGHIHTHVVPRYDPADKTSPEELAADEKYFEATKNKLGII